MKRCKGCKKLVSSVDSRGYCSKCFAQSAGEAIAEKAWEMIPVKVQQTIRVIAWIAVVGYIAYFFLFK